MAEPVGFMDFLHAHEKTSPAKAGDVVYKTVHCRSKLLSGNRGLIMNCSDRVNDRPSTLIHVVFAAVTFRSFFVLWHFSYQGVTG